MMILRNGRQFNRLLASVTAQPNAWILSHNNVSPPITHAALHTTANQLASAGGVKKNLVRGQSVLRESYYRRRDHISDDYALIYRAPMEHTIAGCKHLASFSLAFGGAVAAFQFVSGLPLLSTGHNMQVVIGPLMSDSDELMVFGAAFVVFNAAILYACSRFPLRIYRNRNSYVAMFESFVPMSAKAFPFAAGEVHASFHGRTPWHESMYMMRQRSVLLLAHYFKTPGELNGMLRSNGDGEHGSEHDNDADDGQTLGDEKPKKY